MTRRRRLGIFAVIGLGAAFICFDAIAKTPFGIATPDGSGGFGGPLGPFFAWVAVHQAAFCRSLTAHLSAIKESGSAVWLLLGVAFAYGVFHAAGPGHGKAVISSYLVSSGETVRRGVAISFAAAFVQACSAIVLVGIFSVIIGATAQTMTAMTDWLEVCSYAAIVIVGGWLLWTKTTGHGHGHHHHHHHHQHHDSSRGRHEGHGYEGHQHPAHEGREHANNGDGHARHARDANCDHVSVPPTHALNPPRVPIEPIGAAAMAPSYAVAVRSNREVAAIAGNPIAHAWSAILAVGIRPCSGAIILLVFAVSQGLAGAGVVATFVMALGTGLTVAILATLAVSAKGLALRFVGAETRRGTAIARAFEIGGALIVILFGLSLLGGALYPMLSK